jgi:NADPH2:quinone reductase
VTRFEVGDRVFGFTGFSPGACAEFLCLREDASLALAPVGLTDAEAASLVDGPTTALYFLRDRARVGKGTRVAIVGASGSVGSSAVQVARYLGARVTAVCSGRNEEFVRSLGAHEVVDYTREDFTRTGQRFEVVFDAVGKADHRAASRCLVDGGIFATAVGGLGAYVHDAWTRWFSRTRFVFGMSVEKRAALEEVTSMVRAGALRPLIDRRYTLAEVQLAHSHVESGRKRGNVVIALAPG